ncbi:MAG: MFS transporter [Chloroflexota bacterium]
MATGDEGDAAMPGGETAHHGRERLLLTACATTHAVTDGLVAGIYPLLPLVAAELQLSYTAVGSLRTALVGASSLFQLPAGYATAWVPPTTLLGAGMLWMGLGFAAMAAASGFWQMLTLTVAAGIGGSAQHPLAAAIVSTAYEHKGRGTAISTLNFAGDLGKFVFPALAGVVAVAWGWRSALVFLGMVAVVATVGYFLAARQPQGEPAADHGGAVEGSGWGIRRPRAFALLSIIGIVDNGTRAAALTFLPFLLEAKGLDAARISFLLTLVFACGAAGKFGCGFLADRFGTVAVIVFTEAITALSLVAVAAPPLLVVPLLMAFGFVLNGTSSALYTAVAELVGIAARARGYGLFIYA